ncbi:MAG TPA: RdgB/HAM1 family non-canonical purine NTP pyrophosphatase [Solirubrobacterales bacterium]|nr:RdgB/HAM1 family non-canonical purine NTP pyrophosphatase [Solirubrobacterales bacterium]
MILATQNAHKVHEFGQILEGVDLRPLPDGVEMPPEDGVAFAENALIKARAVRAATGSEVIADDSGIEIAALDGRPGVRSARYAGEEASDGENLTKALRDLDAAGGPADARYVCVIAYIDGQGAEHLFEGFCAGRMIQNPRGDGGFGYDPAFVPEETGESDQRTMAEMTPEEKHAISHRGKAARKLAEYLEN